LANLKKVTVNGKSFQVEVLERLPGEVRFALEGREYKVAWERAITQVGKPKPTARKPKSKLPTGQAKAEASAGEWITAPIPGIVVEILVSPDDKVEAGDPILCLEAMKMENRIYAPKSGTIAEILVSEGQDVSDGQELVKYKK
jgi:biotin carboxyl carrier protein